MNDADDLIPTRGSLISRIKDWGDQHSWQDFFNTYWKLIYSVAVRAGLNETEAHEVVQETVISVAKAIPNFKYDASKCSFKTWLHVLIKRRIADQARKRKRTEGKEERFSEETGTSAIERLADSNSLNQDAVWDQEWQNNLMGAALERVKGKINPKHYQSFYLSVLKEQPARVVAKALRMNVAQVYLVKHRVSGMIKAEISKLEAEII